MVLLITGGLVAASTAALPLVAGFGTNLFQIVFFLGFGIVQALTSFDYADTHHAVAWCGAVIPNLTFYSLPAFGIWKASSKRSPTWRPAAILAWCLFYLASLFWLFPAADGP